MSRPSPEEIEDKILAMLAVAPASCSGIALELGVERIYLGARINKLQRRGAIARQPGSDLWMLPLPGVVQPSNLPGFNGHIYGPPAAKGAHPGDLCGRGYEARFVQDGRSKGRPWSALATMLGKNETDIRRRHDPAWQESRL